MRILAAGLLLLAGLFAPAGSGRGDEKPAAAAKTSYDQLKSLEKSVGRWEGTLTTGGKTAAVTLTVEWMLDKQFLREELRVQVGGKDFAVVLVRGWDAKAGGMTEHAFASGGDSGAGTGKFAEASGEGVAFTSSLAWVSGRKVGQKRAMEFPEADRMVVTDSKRTQDGEAVPDAKLELRRKK